MDKSSNKLFTQGLRPLQSLLPENAKKILKKDGFVYFEIIKNWKNIVGEKIFKDATPSKIKKINNENSLSLNVNKEIILFGKKFFMLMYKYSNKLFTQGLIPLQCFLPENAKKILKKNGFIYFEIIKNWRNIVGEKMFKNVAPLKIKKINNENILSINVNKNIMIEIEYSRDQIIEKINSYLGFNAINKIQIISKDSSFEIKKKKIILNENILKKINEIKSKNLKEIFLKLNK